MTGRLVADRRLEARHRLEFGIARGRGPMRERCFAEAQEPQRFLKVVQRNAARDERQRPFALEADRAFIGIRNAARGVADG